VQDALMEMLLAYGAALEGAVAPDYTRGSVVNACLANGRPHAAEFLAGRGARLDLDGAAGVGRLDVVKNFFNEDGSLKARATQEQMESGFTWACGCGRTNVVEFLLEKGVNVNAMPHGETGLHCAAYGGQLNIVRLLLERRSPLDIKDKTYDATPLGGHSTVGAIHPKPGTAAITRSSCFWFPPVPLWSRSALPMRKYVPILECWRRSTVSCLLGNPSAFPRDENAF
jgi:hypothetical protein